MADEKIMIRTDVDTTGLQKGLSQVSGALGGFEKVCGNLKSAITKSFSVEAVLEFGKECTKAALLAEGGESAISKNIGQIAKHFDELKVAIGRIILPVINAVIPVVDWCMTKLTKLANTISSVVRGAFKLTSDRTSEIADSAISASSAENVLKESITKTASAIKRSVASFDELNRLQANSSGFAATTVPVVVESNISDTAASFSQACGQISQKCDELNGPLGRLKGAFEDVCSGFQTSWENHGGNILAGVEGFKTGIEGNFSYLYDNVISPLCTKWGNDFDWLWGEHMKPLWDNIAESAGNIIENLLKLWNEVVQPLVDKIVENWAPVVTGAIRGISDYFELRFALGSDLLNIFVQDLDGLIQFITGVFTGDWDMACEGLSKAWNGTWNTISSSCKSCLNKAIQSINTMMLEMVRGLNRLIKKINKLSISLPNWSIFGDAAGKSWSLNVQEMALPPMIPMLAQGAVLPANKPFLAMVGDQKHGTNVEAPLSTIQEAVALVMGDQMDAMMAGFNATVEVQREILQAVLGIQIGDEVIGRAAGRYAGTLARARGNV